MSKQSAPPAGGTYPPPDVGMPAGGWQQPPGPDEIHKVGPFTTALGLILTGVLLILHLLIPGLSYGFIARLSPILLVSLGVEVLLANTVYQHKHMRFSGVSVVVCMLLVCTSLAAASVPEYVVNSQKRYDTEVRIQAQLEDDSYELLAGLPIDNVTWYVSLHTSSDTNMAYTDLGSEDYVQFRVRFSANYETPEEFASHCRAVIDALQPLAPSLDYCSFYSRNYDDEDRYTAPSFAVRLDSRYLIALPVSELAEYVEGSYYIPNYGYVEREEYYAWLDGEWDLDENVGAIYDLPGDVVFNDGQYYFPDGSSYSIYGEEAWQGYYSLPGGTVYEDGVYYFPDGSLYSTEEGAAWGDQFYDGLPGGVMYSDEVYYFPDGSTYSLHDTNSWQNLPGDVTFQNGVYYFPDGGWYNTNTGNFAPAVA